MPPSGGGSSQTLFTQTLPPAHPMPPAQPLAQAPPTHRNPRHDVVVSAPLHVPAPLQVVDTTASPSLLHAFWHSVVGGANLQCLRPSHLPVVPQASIESLQLSRSGFPSSTAWQWPAVFAQVSQVPQLGESQQVLSTQWLPVPQSSSFVHCSPRRFFTQVPVATSHALPLQSASEAQVVRHMSLVSQR
jgi:hypothetical protein